MPHKWSTLKTCTVERLKVSAIELRYGIQGKCAEVNNVHHVVCVQLVGLSLLPTKA